MSLLQNAVARWRVARTTGVPEAKSSAVAPLIAMQWQGQAVWSPRDYRAFAREGFMQNAVVYRCVRMISEAAAAVPVRLHIGEEIATEHPLLELLSAPNARQCLPDLLQAFYGFLLVSGNGYLEAASVGGDVRELHALRPDRMKVVAGSDGWPEGFEYSVSGRVHRFFSDESGASPVLHQAFFHPLDDHYGMSPIEAAATAIDIHNKASAWNKALLDNAARPSGALVYAAADGNMTPDQYERLKEELESSFQGARNAGRPMLLEGGLDWKSMGFSPKDMDFIESKNAAAREIALALGVPPMLLGIPGDNTYANFQEANRTFWRQSIVPLVSRTLKALSAWLGPKFGEKLDLRGDFDGVDALSSEREMLWKRLRDSPFLTVNEKRAAAGYGAIDGGDVLAGECR